MKERREKRKAEGEYVGGLFRRVCFGFSIVSLETLGGLIRCGIDFNS